MAFSCIVGPIEPNVDGSFFEVIGRNVDE